MKAENKVAVPQVTPPISGKSLPVREAPALPKASPLPPSRPVTPVTPEPTIPTDEEIRKVLADLETVPFSFAAPAPVITASREAYIPIASFDEALEYIHEAGAAISQTQHLNEKLGHLEGQTKTAIESVGKAFENLQTSFLALDERLFKHR